MISNLYIVISFIVIFGLSLGIGLLGKKKINFTTDVIIFLCISVTTCICYFNQTDGNKIVKAVGVLAIMFVCHRIAETFVKNKKRQYQCFLFIQLLCAIALYVIGIRIDRMGGYWGVNIANFDGVISAIITVVWMMVLMNGVALIKKMRGLAIGASAIAAACICYIAYLHSMEISEGLLKIILAVLLGILPVTIMNLNFTVKKSGCHFIGGMFAVASLVDTVPLKGATIIAFIMPIAFFAVAISISTREIPSIKIKNIRKSFSVQVAKYQKFMNQGFGYRRAILLLFGLYGTMGLAAILYDENFYVECMGLVLVS